MKKETDETMVQWKGVETMSNLTHLFKVGQKVTYRNNDFDAVKRNIPCVVKETYPDHIIITDTETNTDLWIEEGFNMDCVYPEYNMIGVDYMARTQKQIIKSTEEWLDERWAIANMEINKDNPYSADIQYYKGAIAAVEWLGYDWKREDGKHKLFK